MCYWISLADTEITLAPCPNGKWDVWDVASQVTFIKHTKRTAKGYDFFLEWCERPDNSRVAKLQSEI